MTRRRIRLNPAYALFRPFLDNLPGFFDRQGTPLHEGRNTVKAFRLADGTPVVVKRYRVPHLVPRLAYTLGRRSKARRAHEFALRLPYLGIDTPAPIGCIEERAWWGLFGLSYFVCLQDKRPSLWDLYNPALPRRDELIEAFAAFLVHAHLHGFLHGDLNLSNILYDTDEDARFRFAVIDTNRSHFSRHPGHHRCLRNLVRVSHDRALLGHIVRAYARLRHWPPEECERYVMAKLTRFERRDAAKHRLTGKHTTTPAPSTTA